MQLKVVKPGVILLILLDLMHKRELPAIAAAGKPGQE
jgi:hypothetical protein